MTNNVLFLVVDCLRADHVDTYGRRERGLTPFIEEFSRRGVSFEETIAQSSWTKTSVASMITGTYPFTHNVHYMLDKMPPEVTTIAEVYKKAGFVTGYLTSNPYLKTGTGYERGFDIRVLVDEDRGELLNERLTELMDANAKKPFFFYLQYMDAHQPYRIHDDSDVEQKSNVMKKFNTGLRSSGTVKISEEELSILQHLYAQEVRFSDQLLAQVVEHLEGIGLIEKTLVVITADHGIELAEHGGLYHSPKLYNELIKVPLVMVGPGIEAERFVRGRVRSVDIMPTLLAYSGLDIPDTVQGISLLDQINNRDIESISLVAYSERDRTHEQLKLRTLIKDSWKIIEYERREGGMWTGAASLFSLLRHFEFSMLGGALRAGRNYIKRRIKSSLSRERKAAARHDPELYDIAKDPVEKENLSEKAPEKKEKMLANLREFREGKGRFQTDEKISLEKDLTDRLKALGYID